jgi:predicted TIM-barrel fold metal-dependent hydrolase
MAELADTAVRAKSKYLIVDADAHANPPHDMWADYLPDSMKEFAPKVEHGEDADYVIFEGNRRKVNLIGAQAGRTGKDFKMEGRVSDARSGGWMPRARIEDMDQDGMDVQVLFGGGPLGTGNQDLYIESFRSYNRWLSDFCHYDPKRLAGIGYVPMRDVDLAIEMIREFPKLGLKGVNIPAFPMNRNTMQINASTAQTMALTGDVNSDRCYADPEFDPFWAACVELNLPVTIHLGGRGVRFQDKKWFLPDLVMSKLSMAEPISILIFGGVFDRFPDLKLASIESGVGWFGFVANYMDETWHKQRYWVDSKLEHEPSYYMERNIYGSFIHDRAGILMRDLKGAGNIMWSSDYPHSETTYPDSLAKIEELFEGVPEEDKKEILGGRAKKLFNL